MREIRLTRSPQLVCLAAQLGVPEVYLQRMVVFAQEEAACCIAPFAVSDYASIILGNLFERPFAEIWNGAPYQQFRRDFFTEQPHKACASCGVYWSL